MIEQPHDSLPRVAASFLRVSHANPSRVASASFMRQKLKHCFAFKLSSSALISNSCPYSEASIRRCHILVVLLTHLGDDGPQRDFGGAPRIPSTKGVHDLEGITSVLDGVGWKLLYW